MTWHFGGASDAQVKPNNQVQERPVLPCKVPLGGHAYVQRLYAGFVVWLQDHAA
jgi:hypothetical protein